MSNITHTSTGADNTPKYLEVIGYTMPVDHLVMLINHDSMDTYSYGDLVNTLPNQHINPNLAGTDDIVATSWDPASAIYRTMVPTNLNGKNAVKLWTRYIASGTYSSGRTAITKKLNDETGYTYSPGIGGISRSLLIYPNKLLCVTPDQVWHAPSINHVLGHMEIGAGQYTGLMCGSGTAQWKYYCSGDIVNIGLYPELDGQWYHVIIVETLGTNRSVKIYINGVLAFNVSLADKVYTGKVIKLSHLNSTVNPIDRQFNGYYAHGATWLKALTANEINGVISTINHEYGLTNPLISEA